MESYELVFHCYLLEFLRTTAAANFQTVETRQMVSRRSRRLAAARSGRARCLTLWSSNLDAGAARGRRQGLTGIHSRPALKESAFASIVVTDVSWIS